ncbi:MAG TPA: hypothetical protein VF469_08370 [Kofleriaceae bacterium]
MQFVRGGQLATLRRGEAAAMHGSGKDNKRGFGSSAHQAEQPVIAASAALASSSVSVPSSMRAEL